MKLRLLRLDCDVSLGIDQVSTLQILDRTLFTRVVEALLSEEGEYAKEPYLLFDDAGKQISPKRRLIVINTLPSVPLDNRTLIGKLYKRVVQLSEVDAGLYESIQDLSAKLHNAVEMTAGFLRGDYELSEWSFEAYLKAFSLSPLAGNDFSLLDNCIHFFDMVADVAPEMPLVMVNAKTFFSPEELDQLLGQAVFSGVRLLLIETTNDSKRTGHEVVTAIDQHFYVE